MGEISTKPSYLGLLNGIACAESRAGRYFSAWADTTDDPEVRRLLRTVAAREAEHGLAFAKRIDELGFELVETEDGSFDESMEIAGSALSDREKFERLHLEDLNSGILRFFDDVFKDHTIDIATGGLLGRYIAEEYDTGRRLHACYTLLCEAGTSGGGDQPVVRKIEAIEAKLDSLCAAVDELRATAGTSPTTGPSNGKTKRTPARA